MEIVEDSVGSDETICYGATTDARSVRKTGRVHDEDFGFWMVVPNCGCWAVG